MLPLRDDQYISLTPTDSPAEDAEMDSGAVTLGHAEQEGSQHVGRGLTRMPADTPRTPGSKGVNFQQFCDRSLVTRMNEEALIPGLGLSLVTRVPDSMPPHHWSMRLLRRSDTPIGT